MGKAFMLLLSAGVGSLGIALPAYADNCSGHYTAVVTAYESADIGKGHSIAYAANRNSVSSDNSVYNGVGVCTSTILSTPDGKFQVHYACVRKNAAGDSWSLTGTMDSGSDKGTWVSAAGTGAFAGRSGSGWYKPMVNDGKMELGTWGGNCK